MEKKSGRQGPHGFQIVAASTLVGKARRQAQVCGYRALQRRAASLLGTDVTKLCVCTR